MVEQVVLRILVVEPPEGVIFAVQRGRDELLPPEARIGDTLVFEFSLRIADADAQPPRLVGPFAQGPPATRFVYVNSGTLAGQPESYWTRRAKVPLRGISQALLQAALKQTGSRIEASIRGTGRDGGPACASVPLLSEWTLRVTR